jgi:hypothetical protein
MIQAEYDIGGIVGVARGSPASAVVAVSYAIRRASGGEGASCSDDERKVVPDPQARYFGAALEHANPGPRLPRMTLKDRLRSSVVLRRARTSRPTRATLVRRPTERARRCS